MKIIDLLNKMANNEELPKKIKYKNRIYEYKEFDAGFQENKKIKWKKEWDYVAEENRTYYYLKHCYHNLSDEVEIIDEEDKDIPLIPNDELYKISNYNPIDLKQDDEKIDYNFKVLKEKINQVADELNKRQ